MDQKNSNNVTEQIRPYKGAILLDGLIDQRRRASWSSILGFLVVITLLVIFLGKGTDKMDGIFLLLSSVWLSMVLMEFFYNSFYFNLDEQKISYLLAKLLWDSFPGAFDGKNVGSQADASDQVSNAGQAPVSGPFSKGGVDAVKVFLDSDAGKWICFRAGIGPTSIKTFLAERSQSGQGSASSGIADIDKILAAVSSVGTLSQYVSVLVDSDAAFKQFVLGLGIEKEYITGAASWYERREEQISADLRWWSKDSLSRIPGLAKDWAYGQTYFLDKFSQDLLTRKESGEIEADSDAMASDERTVETVLSRQRQANAMIIGNTDDESLEIVFLLARNIREGVASPEIQHARLMALNTIALIDATREKAAFENQFITILNEAVRAGNIILVIEHMPEFVESVERLGCNLGQVLEPYFNSQSLRIIGLADRQTYHRSIEANAALSGSLEKILLKEGSDDALVHLLEYEVEKYEGRNTGLFFTYGAVRELAEGVDRYLSASSNGSDPNKARDLLSELIPRIREVHRKEGKRSSKSAVMVTRADVEALLEQKTGIPLGEISHTEGQKLLNLETILHSRIIGQDEAIVAISNAMRRARSGINNPNRPIGSFLFLGPTGVGKTETTKALAATFFNNENQISRLDMSEYSTADALNRLIGSIQDGKPGILAEMLRDKQYGVLLLDEFEKTNRQVHDLFLQILDEGFFSDINGNKVSARNMIIIATSNAGSDLIFKVVEDTIKAGSVASGDNTGADNAGAILEKKKAEIVDNIVSQGIYRPELLNRFDGIILFHPLEPADLQKIARLMLGGLAKRLEQKGIVLNITQELIDYLVAAGSDPKFGARSMNRAIQENVEQVVAKKIISGEVRPGGTISLGTKDFS